MNLELQSLMADKKVWESIYTTCYPNVVGSIERRFPQIAKADLANEIVHEAILSTVERIQDKDQALVKERCGYVYKCAYNLALKYLEAMKIVQLESIELEDPRSKEIPDLKNYRNRQAGTLSDIYREFTTECESKGGVWIRRKELIERLLSLQTREVDDSVEKWQVAQKRLFAAVQARYALPVETAENTLTQDRKRTGRMIQQIMQKHDANHTILQTMWESPDLREIQPASEGRKKSHREKGTREGFDQKIIKGAEEELSNVEKPFELLRWVAACTTALCPSEQRLIEFDRLPSSSKVSPELLDVGYHVRERGCQLCKELLQLLEIQE